jgi:hypothetical protein
LVNVGGGAWPPPARSLGRIPGGGTLEPLAEQPRGKINTTDPDSRNVKTPRSYTQGYNAQAVVNEHQIGPA